MRYGVWVIALLIGIEATPLRAATCTVDPFSTVPGADVTLHWTVKSGFPCDLTLKVSRDIGVTSMLVAQPAANGRATIPTLSRIHYVPRPGFVGRDRFTVDRTAEAMARFVMHGTAHWTIDVDVVP